MGDLASSLERVAADGAKALYRGPLGRALVRHVREGGGEITRADLESYRVVVRRPVRVEFGRSEFVSNPPPSSGGVLIGYGLRLLDALRERHGPGSADAIAALVEVMREQTRARGGRFQSDLYRGGLARRLYADATVRGALERIRERDSSIEPTAGDHGAQADNQLTSPAGQLLVAMPQMLEQRFARSVIYLCAHSDDADFPVFVDDGALEHLHCAGRANLGECDDRCDPRAARRWESFARLQAADARPRHKISWRSLTPPLPVQGSLAGPMNQTSARANGFLALPFCRREHDAGSNRYAVFPCRLMATMWQTCGRSAESRSLLWIPPPPAALSAPPLNGIAMS